LNREKIPSTRFLKFLPSSFRKEIRKIRPIRGASTLGPFVFVRDHSWFSKIQVRSVALIPPPLLLLPVFGFSTLPPCPQPR
jgi:hypothetical protein